MYVFFMCLFKRMQILVATASVVLLISSCSFKLTPKAKVSESSFDSRAAGNSNPAPTCSSEDLGCDGVCYSGKTYDCARICGGDTHVDCRGVCNGNTEVDCNGDCGGNAVLDCNDNCNGTAVLDDCGVCKGDGSSCADCNGIPNGGAVLDRCGVCDGDGSGCPVAIFTITGLNVIAKNGTPTGLSGEVGDTLQISGANLETSLMMVQFGNIAPVPFSYDANSRILSGLIPVGLAGITSVTVIGANGANVIARDKLNIGSSDCLNGQFDECDVCDGNGTTCTLTPLDDDISLQLRNSKPSVPWTADSPIFDPDGIPPLNKADAPFDMPIDPTVEWKSFFTFLYDERHLSDLSQYINNYPPLQNIDETFDDPEKLTPSCQLTKNLYGQAAYDNWPLPNELVNWIIGGELIVGLNVLRENLIYGKLSGPIIQEDNITWHSLNNQEYELAVDYRVDSDQDRADLVIEIDELILDTNNNNNSSRRTLALFGGQSYQNQDRMGGSNLYVYEITDNHTYKNFSNNQIGIPKQGQVKILWQFYSGRVNFSIYYNGTSIDMYRYPSSSSKFSVNLNPNIRPNHHSWEFSIQGGGYKNTNPNHKSGPLYIDRIQAGSKIISPTPTP